jgi:hypothetical protein
MIWIVAGGALAAVVVLGALAWWLLRCGPSHRLNTPEEAMHAAAQSLTDFAPLSAVVGHDGQSALVFGDGLRVAVLKARRTDAAAREIVWHDVRATPEGLVVATGDRWLGTVLVAGIDNLDVRRLAPQLTRGER